MVIKIKNFGMLKLQPCVRFCFWINKNNFHFQEYFKVLGLGILKWASIQNMHTLRSLLYFKKASVIFS